MFNKSKRLVSLLLCLAMVLAILPMAAFAAGTKTVYFNNGVWTNVNVYYWGGSGAAPSWPGIPMTDMGNGYFTYDVPTDITGIIFNNGAAQTADLTLPAGEENCHNGKAWSVYTGAAVEVKLATVYVDATACGWAGVNAYYWGGTSGCTWPGTAMTAEGNGVYSIELTDDTQNIIFNYGAAQTDDLAFPGDGYIWNGTEFVDYATYTPVGGEVEVDTNYYLRGEMNEWGTDNVMTDNGDGTWSVTVALEAGDYQYKAAYSDWTVAVPAGDNAVVSVATACDVTFTLNVATGTLTATGDGVVVVEPDPMVIESIVAVGGFPEGVEGDLGKFLNGAVWDVESTANVMTNKNGVYTISYTGVAAGTYEFKFAANGGWDISWGTGSAVESGVAADAWFNGANCVLTVAENNSTVTLTLDLSNVNLIDGSGAKMKVDVAAPENTLLETPKIATATNAYNGVKLTWKAVPGAAKYKIVVKEPGGSWKTIWNTVNTSYTWTGAVSGKTYIFGIRCTTADGKAYTSAFDSTGKTIQFIARPSIASLENTGNGIKITWNAVPGAAKYKLVVKEEGGSWKTIWNTVKTSYTWTGAENGKTYTFGIRCTTADGKAYTSAFDSTGKTITPVATPTINKVANAATGVAIAWTKVPGAVKYKIVVKTATSGWKTLGYSTGSTYTWKGATSGVTYTFAIRAVTADGKFYASGFDSKGMSIKYVAAPAIAKLESTATGIKISWNKVAGAEKYKLVVKEEGGSWKTIWNTIKDNYTWTGAKKGVKYTFSIRCINAENTKYTSSWNSTGWTYTWNP